MCAIVFQFFQLRFFVNILCNNFIQDHDIVQSVTAIFAILTIVDYF